MKKYAFTFLLLLAILSFIRAQPVLHFGDILLQSQAQVDSFPVVYPGVTHVVGNMLIGKFDTVPSDIWNLSPLQDLHLISGSLYVRRNGRLKNLQGLTSLDSLYGELKIFLNDSLQTTAGMDSLSLCSYIGIEENDRLLHVEGFKRLDRIHEFGISIRKNLVLKTISNFEALNSMGIISIEKNPALKIVGNFPNLAYCEYFSVNDNDSLVTFGDCPLLESGIPPYSAKLYFRNCPELTSIGNYPSLKYELSQVEIENCPKLAHITGLKNVRHCNTIKLISTGIKELPFDFIETVRGVYLINNDSLKTLIALNTVADTVPVIEIDDNDALPDLSGLDNVNNGIDVLIRNNDLLGHLEGLSGLKEVRSFFTNGIFYGGILDVSNNKSLYSIDGLRNVERVGATFSIGFNSSLVQIDSVFKLKFASTLGFGFDSALVAIDNFPFMEKAGSGVGIGRCPALKSIKGFNSLDSLLGGVGISNNDNLEILEGFSNYRVTIDENTPRSIFLWNNKRLKNFTAFGSFESALKSGIFIRQNDSLETIDALANILYVKDSISLRDNPRLSDCSALCEIMENAFVGKGIRLEGNAFPCNDLDDVEAYCDTLALALEEDAPASPPILQLKAMPNPARAQTMIRLPTGFELPCTWFVTDAYGNVLNQGYANEAEFSVSFDGFPVGTYYVKAANEKGRQAVGTVISISRN